MPVKVATLLCLLAWGSLPPAVFAAPPSDWSRVQELPEGRPVVVVRSGGAAVRGRLAAADSEGITVRTNAGPVTVTRGEVDEVRKSRSRSVRAGQFAAIGAGVGIGVAAALLAATGGSDETAEIVVRGAVIGAGLGAAAGAAASPSKTVYRASGAGGN